MAPLFRLPKMSVAVFLFFVATALVFGLLRGAGSESGKWLAAGALLVTLLIFAAAKAVRERSKGDDDSFS